jgi:hypothetical protein
VDDGAAPDDTHEDGGAVSVQGVPLTGHDGCTVFAARHLVAQSDAWEAAQWQHWQRWQRAEDVDSEEEDDDYEDYTDVGLDEFSPDHIPQGLIGLPLSLLAEGAVSSSPCPPPSATPLPPRYWTGAQAPLLLLNRKLLLNSCEDSSRGLTPAMAVRLVVLSFEQLQSEAAAAGVTVDGADELIPVYTYVLAHAIAASSPRGLHRPWAVVRMVDEDFDFDDLCDGGQAEQRFIIFRSVLEYIERAGF